VFDATKCISIAAPDLRSILFILIAVIPNSSLLQSNPVFNKLQLDVIMIRYDNKLIIHWDEEILNSAVSRGTQLEIHISIKRINIYLTLNFSFSLLSVFVTSFMNTAFYFIRLASFLKLPTILNAFNNPQSMVEVSNFSFGSKSRSVERRLPFAQ